MARIEMLNEIQLDALQETANIGCSHAATAVSQMVNREITITVPSIKIRMLKELYQTLDAISEKNEKIVGVYLELTNEFLGSILFLYPYKSALTLSDLLMYQEVGTTKQLDEMAQSAITEVGNVVVSAYTNALSELLGCSVMLSPPTFSMDFPNVFMDKITKQFGAKNTHAMIFDTLFTGEDNLFQSFFILLPSPQSLDILLQHLASGFADSCDHEVNTYRNSLAATEE
jgi:chemotaxis protein CheC